MLKKFVAICYIAMLSVIAGCCASDTLNVRRNIEARSVIEVSLSSTIALINSNKYVYEAYCGGVWIGDNVVITADHCVKAPIEEFFGIDASTNEDHKRIVETMQLGVTLTLTSRNAVHGSTWRAPDATFDGTVVAFDSLHDLALIVVPAPPTDHPVAQLATRPLAVDDDVIVIGHPMGLSWSYARGYISALREERVQGTKTSGPFIQINSTIWKGHSGCGAFNAQGELIGIASFMAPGPGIAFYISTDVIRNFIADSMK